ncbi:hypothetical protein DLJ61_11340 [Gordonia terrae]|uniref:Uncharacterized protein n=1 Tax=Gordonia terrae TaxID=2055 RepID=A0AAD0NXD5_9ACTN|nr:hypothetical protein BCM27_11245 [Gordonia terrae]AWO84022.1 hypothetical protein DLJ61_11340 [Gordonia terrae]
MRELHPLPPPYTLTTDEARQINFEMVAASHEFTYESPETMIAATLSVPPWPVHDPDGAQTFMEAVLEPSRWQPGEGPSWAVGRWYA